MNTWSNKVKKIELRNDIANLTFGLTRSIVEDTADEYRKKLENFIEELNKLLKIKIINKN